MHQEIIDGVLWVGVVDWNIRHFHGHELSTHRGTSYNSYLIRDEKTVLVDTVWAPFAEEFLHGLRQVIDPSKIDIIVANHAEPDHAGTLPALMRLCPNAQLVCSKRGVESLEGHYQQKWNYHVVKTGDRIPIGKSELAFVEAAMLHWPDSMFTYVAGKNLLLPNDAFGQHYATAYRFNDQVDNQELMHEALKYFANILTPFAEPILRKIDELLAMKLPVDMIAPAHGVIWRNDPLQIVRKYQEWSQQKGQPRAVVLYDTMYEATRRMAQAIADGLCEAGVPVALRHLAVSDRNDVLTEVLEARGLAIGSPTINRAPMPTVCPILESIKGLKFKNKVAAAFGTFGWSGEVVKVLEENFAKCGFDLAGPGVLAKWAPTAEDLEKCRNLGRAMAKKIKGGTAA